MNRLQNFDSFAAARKQEVQVKLQQEQDAKRSSSAETYKSLLAEYGVTDLNELDEEQRTSFFERLRGGEVNEDVNYMIDRLEEAYDSETEEVEEGNAFSAARAKAIANGDKEFTVDGETYPLEDVGEDDKENAEEFAKESVEVNESEVNSEEEFREYAETVLKKAFGDEYDEAKAKDVVDGILGKVDGDFGKAVGILQSSLG